MNTPLNDIQTRLERAIFDNLLNQVVQKGYYVNLHDTIKYPQNPDGSFTQLAQQKINEDLEVIRVAKGFIIPIFNFGSSDHKGLKNVPRIVMAPMGFIDGAVGGDVMPTYVLNQGLYYAEVMPPQTSNYLVNIHAVANSAAQMRILNALIALALPKRGWITSTYSQDKFFLYNNASPMLRDIDISLIENIYQYVFPDLFEVGSKIDDGNPISPLKEVTIGVDINDKLQQEDIIP